MPTFSSAQAFARELDRLDREAAKERRRMGQKIGEEARPDAYREAAKDLGGDPKFSGWRPWLELQVRPKSWGAVIMPTRYSAGPWTVAEHGRNRGNGGGGAFFGPGVNRRTGATARTKTGRVRKVREFRSRRWNGITRGKGTATRSVQRFEKTAERVAEREFKLILRRHFDVS